MTPLISENIKYLVVHCALSRPSDDWDIEDIRRVHKERGFEDVGYHFFIKRDGTVQLGRPLNVQGAHVKGYNDESIGVCLAGGLVSGGKPQISPAAFNYSLAQICALKVQIAQLKTQFPNAEVVGHRDLDKQRTCPGFDVPEFFRTGLVRGGSRA